jgi:hypothetical protein
MGSLQQHKESTLICEEGISMLEKQNTIYVPQTTITRALLQETK